METIENKVNEYWNEHDGTNFYKDELLDFVKGLLINQKKEIEKEIFNGKIVFLQTQKEFIKLALLK